jgi:hypothetical protein
MDPTPVCEQGAIDFRGLAGGAHGRRLPVRRGGAATGAVKPPVRVCRLGLVQLSSLFVNG